MATSSTCPHLPYNVLQNILQFLNVQNRKKARLICKEWNNSLLANSKWNLAYCIPDDPVNNFGRGDLDYTTSEPRIFRHVTFPSLVWQEGFPKTFFFSNTVHTVRMRLAKFDHFMCLILGASMNKLPNLEEIAVLIASDDNEEDRNIRENLKFPEAVALPRLASLRIYAHGRETAAELAFWQALINSAPKLRSLKTAKLLDLSNVKVLQSFSYARPFPNALEKFHDMLNSLSGSLVAMELTISNYATRTERPLPVLPNLSSFNLTVKTHNREPLSENPPFFYNLHKRYPNLKKLSLTFPLSKVIDEMPDLLSASFQNLDVLEVILNQEGDREKELSFLQQFIHNNGKLKVLKLQVNMGRSWIATEDCFQLAMGLKVPNLVLQLGNYCTVSLLVRFLSQVVMQKDKDRLRNKLLEIRNNDDIENPYDTLDRDSYQRVKDFTSTFRKLGKHFECIRLKYFRTPEDILDKIKAEIRSHQLPVEIFH